MKFFMFATLIAFISSAKTYASMEVIGETRDCQIHTRVLRSTSGFQKFVLVKYG